MSSISHIFVLVLENRSFDHMLGFSKINGRDAESGVSTIIDGLSGSESNFATDSSKVTVQSDAPYTMPDDPKHEFEDVMQQLTGARAANAYSRGGVYPPVNNSGFVTSYEDLKPNDQSLVITCFTRKQVPILTQLAEEFAICDHWFSSMPGPTWPNRFFFHAASSGGLDHSPDDLNVIVSFFLAGYKFENGNIFDALDRKNIPWAVYHDDDLPLVLGLHGISALTSPLRQFKNFALDLTDEKFKPKYVFIEPSYGHVLTHKGDMKCGNSQHPLDDVARGEAYIKKVYEAIRKSPHWEESLLIVTYDEHGGFYDHVPPPSIVSPGDVVAHDSNNEHGFDFSQLGVRVPAVVISPWIPRNTIDHRVYDHSAVPATIEDLFGLAPLTERDKAARSLLGLLTLDIPRTDAPLDLVLPADSKIHECDDPMAFERLLAAAPQTEIPLARGHIIGFAHLALKRDLELTPSAGHKARIDQFKNMKTVGQTVDYIKAVRTKIAAHKMSK